MAAVHKCWLLVKGAGAEVHGLRKRADLNGCQCTVVGHGTKGVTDRVEVVRTADGQKLRIKFCNLRMWPHPHKIQGFDVWMPDFDMEPCAVVVVGSSGWKFATQTTRAEFVSAVLQFSKATCTAHALFLRELLKLETTRHKPILTAHLATLDVLIMATMTMQSGLKHEIGALPQSRVAAILEKNLPPAQAVRGPCDLCPHEPPCMDKQSATYRFRDTGAHLTLKRTCLPLPL